MAQHSQLLRCDEPHVVFQECPDEIALCFSFYGCPLRCDGCHSEELWNKEGGAELSLEIFKQYLKRYDGLITAVVFFGGEWNPHSLQALLRQAKESKLKTCLYTGLNHVSRHLRSYLNFAKIGPWRTAFGGLSNPHSNQRFYKLVDGQFSEDLTHLFHQTSFNESSHISQNQIPIKIIEKEPQYAAA